MMLRFPALVVFMALGLAVLSAPPTFAARGGQGGGHASATASLSIWQNGVQVTSAASGSTVEVRCSGLPANRTVYVGLMNAVGLKAVVTDGNGSCSVPWRLEYAGGHTFQVGTLSRKGYTIQAIAPLTVY